MSYAIVGYFDPKTDAFIRSLWKDLADNGICDYLFRSENNPHIKFAMYTTFSLDEVKALLAHFTESHYRLDLHFKNYGFYPNEKPVIFLDISATIPIIQLKNEIQDTFNPFGSKFQSNFFDENIWKPDCFLTVEIVKEKLPQAMELLSNKPLQFNGFLERLGIIEFHPAKQVIAYQLK